MQTESFSRSLSPSISPKPKVPSKAKSKLKASTTNTRTIEVGSSKSTRVAQACDRCRAKKTKCDGKQPSCSNCEAIGIKCIVSDKLSRRAFPKGYTETLEERIRQLEAENSRLSGVIDLRDEQIKGYKQVGLSNTELGHSTTAEKILLSQNLMEHDHTHLHGESCPCGCTTDSDLVHERPVSISLINGDHGPLSITDSLNLSDDDETNSLLSTDDELISNSLGTILLNRSKLYSNKFNDGGANPAPGAFAAATAIEKMQKDPRSRVMFDKQQMLTALVAASIPRSTEETLFVPTMLASICQTYGYDSKTAILAANAVGSLKENSNEVNTTTYRNQVLDESFINIILNKGNHTSLPPADLSTYLRYLRLPSRMQLDHLITIYFQEWAALLPVLSKDSFLKSYSRFAYIIESFKISENDSNTFEGKLVEKFGAILVLVIALSFLSNKHDLFNTGGDKSKAVVDKYVEDLKHYDHLIREFIKPSCMITSTCSIVSLQILSLSLQYFLSIGDVSSCFELRGRVITMAQQLRLHRCPAAVLGVSGNRDDPNLKNLQQGERRILFWCTYCLDVYCSLNLGVPRLLKDYEIECALPFSGRNGDDDEKENENILIVNNTKLTIIGKVSRYSMNFMLYCRVLGGILDGIYSSTQNSSGQETALKREQQLECWRRELPDELRFEMGINGFSLKSESEISQHLQTLSKQQLCLIFLYFHARILIYLPIISKYGNHHDVGLSEKQKLFRGESSKSAMVSSMTMIQQSSLQILEILKILFNPSNSKLLPIPLNIPRQHARLTLLVAKGSLDYIKGGSLYLTLKQLLLNTIPLLSRESKYDVPGGLTKNSGRLLEMAILSILGLPQNKSLLLSKKKASVPFSRPAVDRLPPERSTLSTSIHTNSLFDNSGGFTNNNGNTSLFNQLDSDIYNNEAEVEPKNDLDFNQNDAFMNSNNSQSSSSGNSNNDFTNDENADFDNLFEFDPFKVNLSQNLLIDEFAADGSLGLVPFLDSKEDYDSLVKLEDYDMSRLD